MDVTGHGDVDGVAALPLWRFAPVHAGVGVVRCLDETGVTFGDRPAELAFLSVLVGSGPFHRPAGVGAAKRDAFIFEELRTFWRDGQRGCRDRKHESLRFQLIVKIRILKKTTLGQEILMFV